MTGPRGGLGLPRPWEVLGVALLLGVLLVGFFIRAIRPGRVLSPADLLFLFSPWRHDAPPAFQPANTLLFDYVAQFRPWRTFAVATLRAGSVPLWDPHNYAGAPLLANGSSGVFSPLNLPFFLLPEAPAVLAWAMTRLAIAGVLTYLFARVLALSRTGALVAALAYTFSGFLVAWLLWPQASVAIWLPGLFLAVEAVVRRPTPGRVVALAGVTCVQFLAGHPETSLHVLSAAGLYATWRTVAAVRAERGWRPLARLGACAGAVLLGAGGAAIQLLPLAEYIFLESTVARQRLADLPPTPWHLPPVRWLEMLSLVCPYCFGSYRRGDLPWGDLIGLVNFNELNTGYVGLVTLVLAGLAVALGAWRATEGFFVWLGAASFCVVFAIPPVYNVIHALPLFRVSATPRLLLLLAFSLALLGGAGVDRLAALPEERIPHVLRRLRAILLLAAVALIAAAVYVAAINSPASLAPALGPDGHDRLRAMLTRQAISRVALLALAGLAIHLALRQGGGRRWGVWLLPAVVVIDLFGFGFDYTPAIPARMDYADHPALDFLRRQPRPFRILALDGQLPPNVNAMYGLEEIRGNNALERDRYVRFLDATGPYQRPHRNVPTFAFSNFGSRLVDLLNVKYVLSDRELEHPKLVAVWSGRGVRIYENRMALPRAFVVYRTRVVPDASTAERALRDPTFDPATTVILEGDIRELDGRGESEARTQITEYAPNSVTVDVAGPAPGVLVLADAWFPGWEATVDGAAAPVWPADLALRAVPVPAGSNRVVFRYRPLSFRAGLALSVTAVVVAAGLMVAPRLTR